MHLKKRLFNRIPVVIFIIAVQVSWIAFMLMKLTALFWPISFSLQVISIIAILVIINRRDNPAYKLAWVIPILAFPILGGLLYLVIGGKKPARKMRRSLNQSWERMVGFLSQDTTVFDEMAVLDKTAHGQVHYLWNSATFPVYRNTKTKYYRNGEEMYPDMLEALGSAKHYIFMEYFIIEPGTMWDGILAILKEKARMGVDVRLIYDDLGCLNKLPYGYKEELSKYGIKCEVFNSVRLLFTTVINYRDHRKILVVDGCIGFTGGINLADEYINVISPFGYWKDAGVRLKGEAVYSLTIMFLTTWFSLRRDDEDISMFKPCFDPKICSDHDGYVQPYCDSPLDEEYVAENVYLNIINMATRYVYLYTPYLIIDNELMTSLCLAARRGVDVRIMTPGIPDKKLVFFATQSCYLQLIEAGVKIYEFTPGFLHAKCSVCDDKIATVGTANLDYRSLYLNFECGVYFYGSSVVMALKKDFLDTLEKCIRIDGQAMQHKLPVRLAQSILRLFAPML